MIWSIIVLAVVAVTPAQAVTYSVTNNAVNTAGGIRFDSEIGADYSVSVLSSSTEFIWGVFSQDQQYQKIGKDHVSMFVDDMDGVAYSVNDEIHVSGRYINGYSGDVKREIAGVLYHEMTHQLQWNGNGQAPGGLIEGIADYVRLKADYAPSHWVSAGQGDRWDQGYDVTAHFLDYCHGLNAGFVADLNEKMKNGYSDHFFVELLGKTVDQLWADYKAYYAS